MPPFYKDVGAAFRASVRFAEVLGNIARGRLDNGRPLGGETARQMAREVLDEQGFIWPSKNNPTTSQRSPHGATEESRQASEDQETPETP